MAEVKNKKPNKNKLNIIIIRASLEFEFDFLVSLKTKFSQKFKSYFGVCNMIKEKFILF